MPDALVPTITCGTRVRRQLDAHTRAGSLAAALISVGINRGDRVAVVLRNDIEFLEVALGIAACGANPVPINTRWKAAEMAHVLADADIRLVIAHTEFIATVESAAAQVADAPAIAEVGMSEELVRALRLDPAHARPTHRHPTLEQWIAAHPEPLGYVEGAISDSMGLVYTSGTTGKPKGVARERMTPAQLLAIAGGTAQRMGLVPGGRMLVAGPLYHTSPNAVAVLALRMGADITIMPRWDAEDFLRLVDRDRIQHAKVVPTMLSRLLSLPDETRSRYDVSSLTHLIHSAAPCPPAIKRAAIDWFGTALHEFYGCSEAGAITWITAAEWLENPGSVGRLVDGSAVRILDDHGADLPAGSIGTVHLRGADYWPAFRYLNQPGTRSSPIPGMITVGDTGYLDGNGYLYLTGRSAEIIISGGVNIYPAEIENALLSLPEIEDAAVFGVPTTADLCEAVHAHLVPRPGTAPDSERIRAALAELLADYKLPEIHIVDQLPRDDSGKVYKHQLRAQYLART
ncbi:AMP-binding protein [Nocardia goodfellowii]|uniref:Long-chain acyl-CoA synthetase n=1 Tax=Nocardia goodfellowii TaxID=882446 RepID=A0ABS4QD11_9NOCA|nr:AMP-binding protein [Nocardia goodfellowii]MBP2189574.1 long-chain acyl-CoA synthetase [Nocardia goodfellowii]